MRSRRLFVFSVVVIDAALADERRAARGSLYSVADADGDGDASLGEASETTDDAFGLADSDEDEFGEAAMQRDSLRDVVALKVSVEKSGGSLLVLCFRS